MRNARRPPRPPIAAILLLSALAVALVAAAATYLRARYDWRDLFHALWMVAVRLSRRRLALVLLASVPVVWLVVRRRGSSPAAHVALLAYLGGVVGDAVVLLSLEPLGVSYGPALLPAALLAGVRCAVALGLGLAAWLLGRAKRRPWPWTLVHVAGQALLLAIVVDGFVFEPTRLTLSSVSMPDPHQAGGRPVRIVQISDLHVERANGLTQRVVEAANELQPDIIALTGDYIGGSFVGDAQTVADLRGLVAGLHAPRGIYAISGNTDPDDVGRSLLAGLPVTVLDDEWQAVEVEGRQVVLAGLDVAQSSSALRERRLALAALARGMPHDRFSVLLYHTPDLVPEAAEAEFDLYLTGHTHGGQIRLPFYGALTTFSLYGKRYEMGAYQEQGPGLPEPQGGPGLPEPQGGPGSPEPQGGPGSPEPQGGTLVYVSRGIGMEGWLVPRMRFLCPPEIVCFDIG